MGFQLAAAGKRRDDLQTWVTQEVPRRFVGRLLPIHQVIAREWGRMSAEGRATGRELPATDG